MDNTLDINSNTTQNLIEKKSRSSAHSIFEIVEEEAHQNNAVTADDNKINANENINQIGNLTEVKNVSSQIENKVKIDDQMVSIFDTSLYGNSSDDSLVKLDNRTINKTNLEKKIEKINSTLLFKNLTIILKNDSKDTELNKLANKIKSMSKNMMIELNSNPLLKIDIKFKNQSKSIKKNANNNLIKNKTKIINSTNDKNERISKFYKAYSRNRKLLMIKLARENKPPLFNQNDVDKNQHFKLHNINPSNIIKHYEAPVGKNVMLKGIFLINLDLYKGINKNQQFGPIRNEKQAFEVGLDIPHYGYIEQRNIYNNIPDYVLGNTRI